MKPSEHKHKHQQHHHPHSHHHGSHTHSSAETIGISFFLNLGFVGIEVVGALITGSVSILANALHDLGDCLSLGLAWVLQKFSAKTRDTNFSYGYGRLSLLSAVISGIIISTGSLVILLTAIPHLWNANSSEPHSIGMMLIACFGIGMNAYAAHRLSKGESVSEKMLLWHFIEDVLGWVAVLIGSFFIHWKKWYWVDPLLALAIAAYIFFNIIKNLKQTVKLFLQSVPEGFDESFFLAQIKAISGVLEVHDLHIWSIDGTQHILSLHVALAQKTENQEQSIKEKIREIAKQMGEYHTTIELERPGEACADIC